MSAGDKAIAGCDGAMAALPSALVAGVVGDLAVWNAQTATEVSAAIRGSVELQQEILDRFGWVHRSPAEVDAAITAMTDFVVGLMRQERERCGAICQALDLVASTKDVRQEMKSMKTVATDLERSWDGIRSGDTTLMTCL